MTLLAVERIKLLSTRSPWWCMGLAILLSVGFSALLAWVYKPAQGPFTVESTQRGYTFGLVVIMTMAVLSITTEYRFNTVKTLFLAVPRRSAALLAKAGVVAGLAFVIGELVAIGSYLACLRLRPEADLRLTGGDQWRAVLGMGVVYALSAILALAVGLLLRQTSAAVSVVLIWSLLAERLVSLVPTWGVKIQPWMPITAADRFLTMGIGPDPKGEWLPYDPWTALAYFAGVCAALFAVSLLVANWRDA
ncbi:hypothetical protein D5S17_00665 [Pseudonocardiaceae bacterium YIM PH 21723]|nr:hypothetical protein D5S17_00665 [Pseudonocardiaceae bacterium YIM PH 21723]